jgi:hypothetical protein
MVRRMRLELVTPTNYEAAFALSVRPDQEDLVAPVVKSLAEAYVFPGTMGAARPGPDRAGGGVAAART